MVSEEVNYEIEIAELKRNAYDAMSMKQHEVAIEIYKKILKMTPDDHYVKLALATTYHNLGQYNQAKILYIELMNNFPNDEKIVNNLLSIITQENPYEAVYLLVSLASKKPENAYIQAQTAMAFGKLENYEDAIKYIKKSLALEARNIDYMYNLAVLYDLSKSYTSALNQYKKVISFANTNNLKGYIPYNVILKRVEIINKNL